MKKNFEVVESASFAGNDYLCKNKGEHLKGAS